MNNFSTSSKPQDDGAALHPCLYTSDSAFSNAIGQEVEQTGLLDTIRPLGATLPKDWARKYPTPPFPDGNLTDGFVPRDIDMARVDNACAETTMTTVVSKDNLVAEDYRRAHTTLALPGHPQSDLKDIDHLQALYEMYYSSYADASIENSTRLGYAKTFADALLNLHYPPSQGYKIELDTPRSFVKHGMSFMLKDVRARKDPNHSKNPQPNIGSASGMSKQELEYVMKTRWHSIEPRNIATFVVLALLQFTDDDTGLVTYKYLPHTYFAIMIDSLDYKHLSKANFTHPSDILSDALCTVGRIEEGYGILLHGTQMNFYSYNAGTKWVHEDSDEDGDGVVVGQGIEPSMVPILNARGKDIAIDMVSSDLARVHDIFETQLIVREVIYMNDVAGTKMKPLVLSKTEE
ncbi:hypothetical protein ACN47E_003239 [Coniothyrium glycines]